MTLALRTPSGGGFLAARRNGIGVRVDCPACCGPVVGACCRFGLCSELTPEECTAIGGVYQGNGTLCANTECPVPPRPPCCNGVPSFCRVESFGTGSFEVSVTIDYLSKSRCNRNGPITTAQDSRTLTGTASFFSGGTLCSHSGYWDSGIVAGQTVEYQCVPPVNRTIFFRASGSYNTDSGVATIYGRAGVGFPNFSITINAPNNCHFMTFPAQTVTAGTPSGWPSWQEGTLYLEITVSGTITTTGVYACESARHAGIQFRRNASGIFEPSRTVILPGEENAGCSGCGGNGNGGLVL